MATLHLVNSQRKGGFIAFAHGAVRWLDALHLSTPDEESQQSFRRNVSDGVLTINLCMIPVSTLTCVTDTHCILG